jgi:LPS sulfotransferase NodH
MKPRCYFVCGPTSSGNRLVTRLLVAAGCAGLGDHQQPFDVLGDWNQIELPPASNRPIALYRSLPHGKEGAWINLRRILKAIVRAGFEPFAVVAVRDQTCAERSHELNHACAGDYRRAYRDVFAALGRTPWTFAIYESLTLGGLPAVNALLKRCGLPALATLPESLRNENRKHW